MAAGQGLDDEAVPASMSLSVRRGTEADGPAEPPTGMHVVVLPVTIEIPMTPELRARLGRP